MKNNLEIINKFYSLIQQNTSEKELHWIESATFFPNKLAISFVLVPRFISKKAISNFQNYSIVSFNTWSLERLVRVYILLMIEHKLTKNEFNKIFETLFDTAEINESVALYSVLPFLKDPEKWLYQATNAVRSNIGDTFDSLVFNNEYPSKYFSELAFNQLVMKCIFNNKSLNQIIGFEKRINQNLVNIFSDFVHERWAAGRAVPAATWQFVTLFVNDIVCNDLEIMFNTKDINNRIAAALVCESSNNVKAQMILKNQQFTAIELSKIKLGWSNFEAIESNI